MAPHRPDPDPAAGFGISAAHVISDAYVISANIVTGAELRRHAGILVTGAELRAPRRIRRDAKAARVPASPPPSE